MDLDAVHRVADLLVERNDLDHQLSELIQRPLVSGRLGEWIAGQIFDIDLEKSGTRPGYDGHFQTGKLAGRTVNVKWYLAQQGILDIAPSPDVDYYLVLAGPRAPAGSSRGMHRPWVIANVYLFNRCELVEQLGDHRMGVATSVRSALWKSAEVYPSCRGPLTLTVAQEQALALFSPIETEPATWSAARRVLQAVRALHERGYENVRVEPGMAPSGMFWRVCVYDVNHPENRFRAQTRDQKALNWTTGEVPGGHLVGLTPEVIAERIGKYLELTSPGPSDRAYVEWFRGLMDRCDEVGALPVSYAEYLPKGWWVWRQRGDPEPWPAPPPCVSSQSDSEGRSSNEGSCSDGDGVA